MSRFAIRARSAGRHYSSFTHSTLNSIARFRAVSPSGTFTSSWARPSKKRLIGCYWTEKRCRRIRTSQVFPAERFKMWCQMWPPAQINPVERTIRFVLSMRRYSLWAQTEGFCGRTTIIVHVERVAPSVAIDGVANPNVRCSAHFLSWFAYSLTCLSNPIPSAICILPVAFAWSSSHDLAWDEGLPGA